MTDKNLEKTKQELLNINFDNYTYNEIVKTKKIINKELRFLEKFLKTDYKKHIISPINNLCNVTNVAFTYLANPYKDIEYDLYDFKRYLENVIEVYSDEWILDYIEFYNKKHIFLFGNSENIKKTKYVKRVTKYIKTLELYNEAFTNRYKILKKYLGFNPSKIKQNGVYHIEAKKRYNDEISFIVIKPENQSFLETEYIFRNWSLSTTECYIHDTDGIYREYFKCEYPELFI